MASPIIKFGVLLVMGALFRSARRPVARNRKGHMLLRYPQGFRWFGYVSLALGLWLGWYVVSSPSVTDGALPTSLVALGFCLVGAYFLAEAATVVVVKQNGVVKTALLGDENELRWNAIREVRFSPWSGYLTLSGGDGQTVRISSMLCGFVELLAMLRDRL